MDLTMCGLLVDRAERLARLYATHSDWTDVEQTWFTERQSGRSTRDSARKVFRVLTERYQHASSALPSITILPDIFDACDTRKEKAQILYLYLLNDDPLVRYTIHDYVRQFDARGTETLEFDSPTVLETIQSLRYADGGEVDYAESTLERWCEGFRSVLREIGVLESQQTFQGTVPTVGRAPLLTAASYSWERQGEGWLTQPVGWLYLFQPEQMWEQLAKRVGEEPDWQFSEVRGEVRLRPEGKTYAWADDGA